MRIIFTGLTSFTGMWFVQTLRGQGHDVLAVMRGARADYSGLRAQRLARLEGRCEFAWGASFGTPEFMELLERPFDLLCHHGADATNYKSPDFDVHSATRNNSLNLPAVLERLKANGCRRVLLTGSVFEADEGRGEEPLQAFSPYGLSKTLTAEIFRYYADRAGMALGKFVIPNPFGPLEEPRFTDYLLRCWSEGKTATVGTPAYLRDNIHVSLLALAYARFAAELPETGWHHLNPSGYAESQGAFAQRFAREIGARLELDCPLVLADQTAFPEPRTRLSTDSVEEPDWSEGRAWDDLAAYYRAKFGLK